jgi:hypothetical protein
MADFGSVGEQMAKLCELCRRYEKHNLIKEGRMTPPSYKGRIEL